VTAWPGGGKVAVVLNIMLEQWAEDTAPGLGPMGNPLGGAVHDYQAQSWGRYGANTGARKLLAVLGARAAAATFYVSGILAANQPELVAEIAADGHEIAAHGWAQNIVPATLDKDTERAQLQQSIAALRDACGVPPEGWISPRCTPSADTAELLAEAGLTWFGDVFDADDPYLLETARGSIVALPFGLDVNDLPMMVRYGQPARELVDTFETLLDAAIAEDQLTYLDVTVHAHVAGRLIGRRQLDLILNRIAADNIWVATRQQIAAQFVANSTEPPGKGDSVVGGIR